MRVNLQGFESFIPFYVNENITPENHRFFLRACRLKKNWIWFSGLVYDKPRAACSFFGELDSLIRTVRNKTTWYDLWRFAYAGLCKLFILYFCLLYFMFHNFNFKLYNSKSNGCYIHNWSLQPFSRDYDLASHTADVCVNFIQEWRDLQLKVNSDRFLEKLFFIKYILTLKKY